jgi:hypothetical protein
MSQIKLITFNALKNMKTLQGYFERARYQSIHGTQTLAQPREIGGFSAS